MASTPNHNQQQQQEQHIQTEQSSAVGTQQTSTNTSDETAETDKPRRYYFSFRRNVEFKYIIFI